MRTVVSQLFQIVSLQLDTIELFKSTQTLNLCLSLTFTHHHFSVLITGKLIKQVFLREALAVLLFRSKILRDSKSRHDRRMVYRVELHLVTDIYRIRQSLRHIRKDFVHFLPRLHPLLLGIQHTLGVVQVFSGTQANQAVVRLGILFVHKVHIVGTNQLYIIFL